MEKQFYTVKEFMEITGGSRAWAYILTTTGEVPTVRLGRKVLIPGWYLKKLSSEPIQKMNP